MTISEDEQADEIPLTGCAPIPLAAYLKALGILRILVEQKDPGARGFWRDEAFVVKTTLDSRALVEFFLQEYEPTPIISPWNGGSGFFANDAKDGIEALVSSKAVRFDAYRTAIERATAVLGQLGLTEKPSKDVKPALLSELRSTLPDRCLPWFDASVVLTSGGPTFPPLLGTGGNDGRFEFSNNHMRRLVSLFEVTGGTPTPKARAHIGASLFGAAVPGLGSGAIGQFSPGAAGGANASTGFGGDPLLTDWDFVLMLEGALLFGAAAARRLEIPETAAMVAPFTVRPAGSGSGAANFADEETARAEFWAPLWRAPAALTEVEALLREGRVTVARRQQARDGLDFVRAVASLGVERGVQAFERFGFFMRSGRTYFATPLGRMRVERNPDVNLIDELDRDHWLSSVRRLARADTAPERLRSRVRDLEHAIFAVAQARGDSRAVQKVLGALGAVALQLSTSEARRPPDQRLAPPPPLSSAWIESADDGSREFRVAAALASIGTWPEGTVQNVERDLDLEQEDWPADAPATAVASRARGVWLPMACHLVALDEGLLNPDRGRRRFGFATSSSTQVWGPRELVRNLAAVAERRLLEATRRGLADKPMAGHPALSAALDDVLDFLGRDTDDDRIAELLQGLVWVDAGVRSDRGAVRPIAAKSPRERESRPLPLSYALLKPLFVPDATLRTELRLSDGKKRALLGPKQSMPMPPDVMRLLSGGDWARALSRARWRIRSSGLPCSFGVDKPVLPFDAMRLLAALLIPVGPDALVRIIERIAPSIAEQTDRGGTDAT